MIKLICGRSRSGKTTYSRQFRNVMHLDTYGVHPKSYPKCLEAVASHEGDLIIDGIFDTAERRKALLQAYKGGNPKICIWIDTPLEVIEERIRKYSRRELPDPFEPPTYSEGWDEIRIIRNGEETIITN